MSNAETIRAARKTAGLSCAQAGSLAGVNGHTWQRWEGQTARKTEIPLANWELFLLKTGNHPDFQLIEKKENNIFSIK